jgi:hypothetical protein
MLSLCLTLWHLQARKGGVLPLRVSSQNHALQLCAFCTFFWLLRVASDYLSTSGYFFPADANKQLTVHSTL